MHITRFINEPTHAKTNNVVKFSHFGIFAIFKNLIFPGHFDAKYTILLNKLYQL